TSRRWWSCSTRPVTPRRRLGDASPREARVPSLREVESDLRLALLGGDDAPARAWIRGDGLAPAARLAIYRHHVVTTLTAALQAVFPVVCRLVDERFFAYATDRYIRVDPPSGP